MFTFLTFNTQQTKLDGQPSKLTPTAELDMTMSVLEWAQRVGYGHLLSPSQYLPAKPVSHEIPKDSVGQSGPDLLDKQQI